MTANQIFTVIGSLAFIVFLLLGTAWLAKRNNWLSSKNNQISMQIISSHRLGPKSSITAVKIADTCLIIGVTPQNISLLHKMPASEEPDFAKELGHAKANQ